jgi:NADH-quinone oxidoreductase subunit L
MRLWLRTFFGPLTTSKAHEPSWLMRGPLVVLAVPSVLFGLLALTGAIGDRLGIHELEPFAPEAFGPLALALLGALLSWSAWRRLETGDPARMIPGRSALAAAYGLDAVNDALVVQPMRRLARLIKAGDETIVDGVVGGTGRGTSALGTLLALVHRASLPRAATATFAGVLLLAVAVVTMNGVIR